MRWTFTCPGHEKSAVAEQKEATKKAPHMYPAANFDRAEDSRSWATMPISKQKLVMPEMFGVEHFFHRGAHMPLMVFIGDKNRTRRSKEAFTNRNHDATRRQWDAKRRADYKITAGGGDWRCIEEETDAKWNHSSSSSSCWNTSWRWKEGWSSTQ